MSDYYSYRGFKEAKHVKNIKLSAIKRILSKSIDTKKIGKLMGSYTDGCVYHYGKDKVIKISGPWIDSKYKKNFLKLLKEVKIKKPSCVVRVFDFGEFKDGTIWYIMKKLKPTNSYQFSFYDLEDLIYSRKYNGEKQYTEVSKRRYRSFNSLKKIASKHFISDKNCLNFVYNLCKFKNIYYDLQSTNVCQDGRKQFKLIDLESFIFPYLAAMNEAYK